MWTAAILAGGRARRLGGRDKSALVLADRTILERQVAELAPHAERVLLITSRPPRAVPPGVAVVADRMPGRGALGGIYTALVASTTERTAVVAGDMPFVSGRFLAFLAGLAPEADLVLPRSRDGFQPLCAVFSRRAADPIRRQLDEGVLKIVSLIGRLNVQEVGPEAIAPFDPEGTLFLNVNTPEDYARARQLADARHNHGRPLTTD